MNDSKVVAVDFETYYDDECSVTTLDVDAYCNHPQFNPYLVSIVGNGLQYVGHPSMFDWSKIHGMHWVSHNARFDETVYSTAVRKHIIPTGSNPSAWSCTADLSVFLKAPRTLKGAAKALLGKSVDKSVRTQMKGRTEASQVVKDYALADAQLCLELWEFGSRRWSDREQSVSLYNRKWGRYGVKIDRDALVTAIKHLQNLRWDAEQSIPWEWDEGKTPLAWGFIKAECRRANIPVPSSFAQTSEECLEWEDKYAAVYPWINALRTWRRTNMLLKKLETMYSRLRDDDILPYSTKYFGAHTGRFSGSGGFNIQNLPRGEIFGVDMRSLIIPRPGKKFVISDLAQIEARVLLHLAGDTRMLDKVREGFSIYEAYARDKGLYSGAEKLKVADPGLYQLAKAMVLGLGYGCGKARFKEVAWLLARVDITPEQSVQYVEDYRRSNPKITNLWYSLDTALKQSASAKEDLIIELPSGRTLEYFNPRFTTKGVEAQVQRTGPFLSTYGGKLTENLVQAASRDVLVEAFKPLDDAGLGPRFHVHDEIICEVDESVPDKEACHEVARIMGSTPAWLDGCPIDTEAAIAHKYTK